MRCVLWGYSLAVFVTIAHAVGDLGPIDYESPSSLYGDISPSSSSNDIPTPRPLDSGWNSPGAYDGTFTAGLTGASQVKDTAVVDSCDGQPNRKWRRLDNRGNNPACHQEPAGADTQPEPDTKTKDQLYPITHNHELCLPDIYGWLGALVICDRGREDLRHLDFATGGWIIEDVLPFDILEGCWQPRKKWCCHQMKKDAEFLKLGIIYWWAYECQELDHSQ